MEALSQSRYFVLLASPEAAHSHWIEQEVSWWRENRSRDTLLIALTDGELGWDEGLGDFESAAAIPAALRGWFSTEPLWVDLRWARGERDLSMRNPRFRDGVGDLAAPLHSLPKDELIGEDINQHRRTMHLARAAVALLLLLLVLAAVGGVVALVQRNRAEEERNLAFARELAAESAAQRTTDPELALLLGIEAVRTQALPETEAALRAALTDDHLEAVIPVARRRLNSIEFSPDGRTVLAAVGDGKARLIDVSPRVVAETLRAGPPGITDAAFARRGHLVLTTNDRSVSKLWNATTGRLVRALPDRRDQVTSGAISPNGKWIATVGLKGIHLWTSDGKSRGVYGSPRDPINTLAFSPNGRLLASGDWLGVVRVRRVTGGTVDGKMRASLDPIESVAFGPAGRAVISAGADGVVRAWDVRSGKPDTLLKEPSGTLYPKEALAAKVSSDDLLAVGNGDGTLVVKDFVFTGKGFTTQTAGEAVMDVDFSPHGDSVATAQADGSVRLLGVTTTDRLVAALGPEMGIQSLAFSRDGRFVAETFPTVFGEAGTDTSQLPKGTWVWRLQDRRVWKVSASGWDRRADFSPDGHLLAIAGRAGTRVWPVFAHPPTLRFPAPSVDVAFSPDGTLLAIAEQSGDAQVRHVRDGRVVEVLSGQGPRIRRISFSPDGSSLLALGFDGVIRLWDRDREKVVQSFGNRQLRFTDAMFSPDGDTIAAVSGARVSIIELESGATVRTAPLSSHRLRSVDYSADGRVLVVADEDGKATALDAESLRRITEFIVTGESLSGAAFGVNAAFVALSGDGGVRVYRCDLCAPVSRLLTIARANASRGLSPIERRRYLHRG